MKELPEGCIDLTVTSPPYDNLRDYKGYSFDFEPIAKELYRITKPGGVVVWIVGDATIKGSETGTSFRQALYFKEIGFNLHDTMIYEKDGAPFPDKTRYYNSFEYMFVLSKGKPKTFNQLCDRKNKYVGKRKSQTVRQKDGTLIKVPEKVNKEFGARFNIWRINSGKGKTTLDEYAFEHPAMFPEQLAEDHILSWSNEGDVVFDPFLGSGTTAKMAVLNNRHYIGFEISEEYFDICSKRLDDAEKTLENRSVKNEAE
jgi:site-specific DNA-methyltransferase (adenine-specific)